MDNGRGSQSEGGEVGMRLHEINMKVGTKGINHTSENEFTVNAGLEVSFMRPPTKADICGCDWEVVEDKPAIAVGDEIWAHKKCGSKRRLCKVLEIKDGYRALHLVSEHDYPCVCDIQESMPVTLIHKGPKVHEMEIKVHGDDIWPTHPISKFLHSVADGEYRMTLTPMEDDNV